MDYGDYVTKPGLYILNTPGKDVESTTAMDGAPVTTGLGTPAGNPVAQVIRVSSKSTIAPRTMPVLWILIPVQ